MRELKTFQDLTLHHPLVQEDYMIPKDNRELMRNPNDHNPPVSCAIHPLSFGVNPLSCGVHTLSCDIHLDP